MPIICADPGVLESCKNITTTQYAQMLTPPSMIDTLFVSPFFWAFMAIVVIGVLIYTLKKEKPADPSVKPWYFRDLRRDTLKKEYKKRFDVMSRKISNGILERGAIVIGIPQQVEYDRVHIHKIQKDPKTHKDVVVQGEWHRVDRIKFRKTGFMAQILALLGIGYEYITLTPDSYKTRPDTAKYFLNKSKRKTILSIDPEVHLMNDSGVWTLKDKRTQIANLEILMKAEHENLHGSELDNLRRQAVHSVETAKRMELSSHEAELREKERQNRTKPYGG